jgi:molybdenum-dependent DNA-binding transcriptional regulator ModE
MKIRKVSYFLALYEEQSFTRAARRCGIAQPSLTRAIQLLEEEVGGRLFERGNSSVRLTDLGTALLADFTAISRAVENIRRTATNFAAPDAATSEHNPPEASMRALTIAVATISILVAGTALQTTPPATAFEPAQTGAQVDPYALQLAVDQQSLPVQTTENLF